MLSFLRGTGPKEASPSLPRKAELVDSVKYTPVSDMDSVEIGKIGFVIALLIRVYLYIMGDSFPKCLAIVTALFCDNFYVSL